MMSRRKPSQANDPAIAAVNRLVADANLSLERQLDLLRESGVVFSEGVLRAAHQLASSYDYYRLVRSLYLFNIRTPAAASSTFVHVSLQDLITVNELDVLLQEVLLGITLFIERQARLLIQRSAEAHPEEDGMEIVADYLKALNPTYRRIRMNELKKLISASHDVLTSHAEELFDGNQPIPLWEFLDNCTFGALADFCHFLAKRWNDAAFQELFLLLRFPVSLRNSCAHQKILLPCCIFQSKGFRRDLLLKWTRKTGLSNNVITHWLSNRYVQQIVGSLMALERFSMGMDAGTQFERLNVLEERLSSTLSRYGSHNTRIQGLFSFLVSVIKHVTLPWKGIPVDIPLGND